MSYPKYDRINAYGMRARDNGYSVRLKKDITALGHLSFTLFVMVLCLASGWLGSAGVFG